jgi:hypothetical protein
LLALADLGADVVMLCRSRERGETRDGLELTLATHVGGPFLLTRLLEPRLRAAKDGRVIWVSSGGMYTRRLSLRDPNRERRRYDGVIAYAETKRAQVILSVPEATQVNDAPHPAPPRRRSEVARSHPVLLLEVSARAHRVDEVVGRFDPCERGPERLGLQDVTLDYLIRRCHP